MKINNILLALPLTLAFTFSLPAFADTACDLSKYQCTTLIVSPSISIPQDIILTLTEVSADGKSSSFTKDGTIVDRQHTTSDSPDKVKAYHGVFTFKNHPGQCIVDIPNIVIGTAPTWEITEQNGEYSCHKIN